MMRYHSGADAETVKETLEEVRKRNPVARFLAAL